MKKATWYMNAQCLRRVRMTNEQYQLSVKLNEDRPLRNKLKALKLQLEEYDTKIGVGAISYESDGSKAEKNGNSVERKVINYIGDVEEIKDEIERLTEILSVKIKQKKELINNLKDSQLYAIASMLYISYMTTEQVAEVMECEVRTIYRKKKTILNMLSNVIECQYN